MSANNFIERLLKMMVTHEASDLYVTRGIPPMMKVDGVIRRVGKNDLSGEQSKELVWAILDGEQKAEFEETNELNLAIAPEDIGRFRVNVFVQRGDVGMVIRQIKTELLTLDQLGLPTVLKDLMETKRGLILVTGATGSGKSTSLAAMIDYRNKLRPGHIITIEDPIEFVHQHRKCIITQREVGIDTTSFHEALKNTLRQAPDVILIGEIRDATTMKAALTFSETGHLVLGTLHSNNANQTIERVLSFFSPKEANQIYKVLGLNLRAVISQRLIRTVDDGRTAALEILVGSPRVQDLITAGKIGDLKTTIEEGGHDHMQTFDQSLYKLIMDDRITLEEGLKHADSSNNLRLRVQTTSDKVERSTDFDLEATE